jgi:two-component system, chemotaxis family, sensor kinase Cph1
MSFCFPCTGLSPLPGESHTHLFIEEGERIAYLSRLKDVHEQLIMSLSQHDVSLPVGLTKGQPNLLDIVAADGAAVCIDGTCSSIGKTPSEREIEQLLDWLVL